MVTELNFSDLLNIRGSLELNVENLNKLESINTYYFKIGKINTYLKILKMIKEYSEV